ncbi:MAG: thioesterase family protein [Pseudomonadales bacterium]|nr:thioesterase family protein [Pseudomonadales bacterium]MDG2035712.1 thioesterase family protein [Pseudomonadales bacterium]
MNYSHFETLTKTSGACVIDPTWTQGRSAFGGLTAALVLAYIESQADLAGRDLLTININFCGPAIAGETCEFRHKILSQGKSVMQVEGQLIQDGEVKTQIVTCFGMQRFSNIQLTPALKVFPEKSIQVPFMSGLMPEFVQHLDVKYTSKHMPFSGSKAAQVSGWVRLSESPDVFCDGALVTLIDAWPPAILPMLEQVAPSSSITWNIEFLHPRKQLGADDYIYYECEAVQAVAGYAHSEAKIYDQEGRLIALSRQLVGVYEKKK